MSVKIRLARHGSKKNPIYRVVVADSRVPRDGRTIEEIGRYNPQIQPSLVEIDAERAREWLSRGAQPTDDRSEAAHHRRGLGGRRGGAPRVPGARARRHPDDVRVERQ